MKKILLLSLILIASFIICAQDVTVREVSGRVESMIPGGVWKAVEKGDVIPLSASISTGFQSRAVLESSRSTIIVQPLTRLTIDELQSRSADSQTRISLRTGRILASVKKSTEEPSRFQVKSPVATAAVRGTEFDFNGFQLSVDSGLVAFSSEGGRIVTVPLGALTEMSGDGIPLDVLEAMIQELTVNPSAVQGTVIPLLESLGLIDFAAGDLVVTVQ
jgi:hypothetical protein